MMKYVPITAPPKRTLAMNPKKFLLWMFMVSIVMVFAALTSAYLVRQAEGNWLDYNLPSVLWISTIIILISSASVQWSLWSMKKGNVLTAKISLAVTFLFGLAFMFSQFNAWEILVANEVYFVGNPGGSFLYVLTGFHGFHLISGLIYLIVIYVMISTKKVNKENILPMELSTTYWHFLDGLWLYLFVFLLINH